MIPLKDNIPAQRLPVVTIGLIAACAIVWLVQLAKPDLILGLGMVPARVLDPDGGWNLGFARPGAQYYSVPDALVPDWLTLLTCTFLHGGWLHFLGNMLFLWIFGDNVEDRLGRLGFLGFYLGCGVAASAAHLLISPDSPVPTIGASGAIAGVMGAYMLLYPRSKVQMLIIWGFFIDVVVLPAPWFLGYWFVLQFIQGTMTLGNSGGGVAFWAHIGGFIAGIGVAGGLLAAHRLRPPPPTVTLARRRFGGRFGGRSGGRWG